jgi:hypothetical protein
MHAMLQRGRVLLLDAPWLYTYVQTGVNTWTAQHFEAIWQAASFVEIPSGYDAALGALEAQGARGVYVDYSRHVAPRSVIPAEAGNHAQSAHPQHGFPPTRE